MIILKQNKCFFFILCAALVNLRRRRIRVDEDDDY